MRISNSLCRLGLSTTCSAALLQNRDQPSLPLPSRTLYQFSSNNTWIENIAVRPNGNLLVTLLQPAAELWQIPIAAPEDASRVYAFPGIAGLVGIAETAPDTFVVAGGNFTTDPTNSSSSVWEVRFDGGDTVVAARKVADLPGATILNGVAAVPGCPEAPTAVLVADSMLGLAWHVDTATGAVATAARVPAMAPANGSQYVGINGLHVVRGDGDDDSGGGYYHDLYFDNSPAAALYRLRINATGYADAAADATAELVAQLAGEAFVDDFALGPDGAIWAATNYGGAVRRVNVTTGESVIVAGATAAADANTSVLRGDTAVAFGRTAADAHVLYVTTSGYVDDDTVPVEPGKVVAVDTSGYW